jgi:hypothetical protein
MLDNLDGALKIWATEYGLPTSQVSDQKQADFIEDFLDAWDDIEYAGPAFIYSLRDRLDATKTQGSFGIFNYDWTPKLAVQVIKDAIGAIVQPEEPGDPEPPQDLGTAIGQVLTQLYQTLVQMVQTVVTAATAYVNAIAHVVAGLFSGLGSIASGLAIPPEQQAEVAEGTAAAARSVSTTTADLETPKEGVAGEETEGVATEETADPAAAEQAAAEDLAAVEAEAAGAEVTPTDVTEVEALVTEEVTTEETTTTKVVETEEPTTVTEEPTSTEVAKAEEPKTADEPKTDLPVNRKESEDEADDEAKEDSDKKSDDGEPVGRQKTPKVAAPAKTEEKSPAPKKIAAEDDAEAANESESAPAA